jgi:hypothetical protein
MNKKEKNIKPKQSNFLLTINTNQQYKDNDEHLDNDIEVFDSTIKDLLNNVDQYINLIVNNCLNFTEEQKKIIKNNSRGKSFKIALIDNVYEEGYPHTRENIIFVGPKAIALPGRSPWATNISIYCHLLSCLYHIVGTTTLKDRNINCGPNM